MNGGLSNSIPTSYSSSNNFILENLLFIVKRRLYKSFTSSVLLFLSSCKTAAKLVQVQTASYCYVPYVNLLHPCRAVLDAMKKHHTDTSLLENALHTLASFAETGTWKDLYMHTSMQLWVMLPSMPSCANWLILPFPISSLTGPLPLHSSSSLLLPPPPCRLFPPPHFPPCSS